MEELAIKISQLTGKTTESVIEEIKNKQKAKKINELTKQLEELMAGPKVEKPSELPPKKKHVTKKKSIEEIPSISF